MPAIMFRVLVTSSLGLPGRCGARVVMWDVVAQTAQTWRVLPRQG